MSTAGLTLTPFMLGAPAVTARFLPRSPRADMVELDVLSPTTQTFYRLLNAGNQHAFGGLGMPAWVQLDCCTLPTAMIGFAVPRRELSVQLYDALLLHVERTFGARAAEQARDHEGLVPVSEYCALGTPVEGRVVGFSLFSLMPGGHLGIATKALALLCYGAKTQVGLTQYGNSAVKTHALLGALKVTHASAPPHSRPLETFVYEVDVSDENHLKTLMQGHAQPRPNQPAANHFIPVADGALAGLAVSKLLQQPTSVHVVAPGLRIQDGVMELCLHVSAA